jgi:hypothetical protein
VIEVSFNNPQNTAKGAIEYTLSFVLEDNVIGSIAAAKIVLSESKLRAMDAPCTFFDLKHGALLRNLYKNSRTGNIE